MITDTDLRNRALLTWYEEHRRDLPWRTSTDPYPVLVSEVMLQQTQVSRVIPKFESFLEAFPTIGHLARASTSDLLAEWSGLGYNSRALRLRDAARLIDSAGWPTTSTDLMQLPGVGRYTAAAVASISFGEPIAAVDTNLKRILSRWEGDSLDGSDLERVAALCVDDDAGSWNQALMDLGSTLCTPRDPRCGPCPVSAWCSDPAVYEPPARQSTFEGSRRQLRGAMVRASVNGDDPRKAGYALDRTEDEIESVLEDLEDEGLLEISESRTQSPEPAS